MKIFINGFLLSIFAICQFTLIQGLSSEKEGKEVYKNLQRSVKKDNAVLLLDASIEERRKRSKLAYEDNTETDELKVLGHLSQDNVLQARVIRSSGDHDISVTEKPINPDKHYEDTPVANAEDSMQVVSTVDHGMEGAQDNIRTGIEVESEQRLSDDDSSAQELTPPELPSNQISLTSRSNTMDQILWPSGTYGLPKAVSGCPDSSGFIWKSGIRFYDTEDDGTENHKSATYHLAGDVTEDGVTMEFCIKTKEVGISSWPPGKYCVYKKSNMCPDGLRSGFVYWDDENRENKNFYDGVLPEGVYNDKTKVSFCCSFSGDVNSEIVLPTEKPFYLFPFGSSHCQKVQKMKSTLEFVKFDEEDRGVIEKSAAGFYPFGVDPVEKDHTLFMCYYQQLDDDDELMLSSGVSNSEKVAHSERIIHEFMKAKDPNDEGIEKQEISRARNMNNFQPIQTSTYHAIVIATGFVLTTIAILVAALLVISYFTKRWTKDLTNQPRRSHEAKNNTKQALLLENQDSPSATASSKVKCKNERSDVDPIETEQEDEELVEDQFLPSDSQLKSGLEFLFLKQQNKKWLARHNRRK